MAELKPQGRAFKAFNLTFLEVILYMPSCSAIVWNLEALPIIPVLYKSCKHPDLETLSHCLRFHVQHYCSIPSIPL